MLAERLTSLDAAQPKNDSRLTDLRRQIAECDRKLDRHRAVLEAGGDPKLVATWSLEVEAQKATAQAQLAQLDGPAGQGRRMSRSEIRGVVEALGGLLKILRSADAADVAEVYRQLGLTLTYDHETQKVLVESRPAPMGVVRVSEGGLEHYAHALHRVSVLAEM